jgi:hypothetical protein
LRADVVSVHPKLSVTTYKPASLSASVMASTAERGTEKPSASFSGSGCVSATGGGGKGSLSSGIESCTCVTPLVALDVLVFLGDSGMVPFGASVLVWRVRLGESDLWEALGLRERRRKGEVGRSAVGPREELKFSRSFVLPLPNPLKAEPKFDDDFRSGDVARPYGCTLCLRRPNTVPKRLRGFELCFSGTEPLFWLLLSSAAGGDAGPGGGAKLREGVPALLNLRKGGGTSPLRILSAHVCISSAVSMFNMAFSVSSAVSLLRSTWSTSCVWNCVRTSRR